MSACFSYTASRDCLYRYYFKRSGLRSVTTDLGNDTLMHCWVPRHKRNAAGPPRPALVLVHGFGANAMWQYGDVLRHFTSQFDLYVPDLVFFGQSHTLRPERSVSFQARCVKDMMECLGVTRMSLVGISYGGFVGYEMAADFPGSIEKLVLCCAGVCIEEKDLQEGLFRVSNLDEAAEILMPQTPAKLRQLLRLSFVKPMRRVPNCFLWDFIHVMCSEYVEEKKELIQALLRDRKLSDLPRITQPTLVIWGEQDQVFPLELGFRLKSHVGESAELVVIKDAGHAVNLEKPREFIKQLKLFLLH